ncbi:hypothetical protein NPS01_25070 [Nocardioides psychrotolerans]|uniref:GIY-YIG domain-containing protein n=1 Tax=Nocardioides psychrotolerans TaxID=1005945 RepID=A0A1I3LL25_9ACTN|nr:hypothetical protein [Nocardioides psychrotolerans]GEP38844.1 hypothetical protein NPS01_25070 [Nocardioides psychrotolerans]SFI85220.1 hypothetical protein SAMN05216561_1149 [Nocardioides psychrotolerans]
MTELYDVISHVHCNAPRPAGAMRTKIKTTYVVSERSHKRSRAHRPTYAVLATIDGRTILGARFACGSANSIVRPIAELPQHVLACEACEAAAANPGGFAVYAYYDATGRVLYVGQSNNLFNRHKAHRSTAPWFATAMHRGTLSRHETRSAALAAEALAIAEMRPLHNVRGVPS